MTILRSAAALALPLCLLGCSTTQAGDAIATPATPPAASQTIAPSPKTSLAVTPEETTLPTNLQETSPAETHLKETGSKETSPKDFSLKPVPPNGWDNLTEPELRYFQGMGPLEYAARLGGVPQTPTWRMRLQLNPIQEGSDFAYQVRLDHYNLSPQLYESLVSSYGDADPSLNNEAPHRHIDLKFLPIMNVAADWLPDATQIRTSPVTGSERCGLGQDCIALYDPDGQEWGEDEPGGALEPSPWAGDIDPLPMQMVRALAKQAGWMQNGSWSQPQEIPEGLSRDRPWVEVLITNYAGNGGGYVAHWIERGMDDSVTAVVHRLTSFRGGGTNFTHKAYVCSRGDGAGKIRTICP